MCVCVCVVCAGCVVCVGCVVCGGCGGCAESASGAARVAQAHLVHGALHGRQARVQLRAVVGGAQAEPTPNEYPAFTFRYRTNMQVVTVKENLLLPPV